jgi:hypothetical protein
MQQNRKFLNRSGIAQLTLGGFVGILPAHRHRKEKSRIHHEGPKDTKETILAATGKFLAPSTLSSPRIGG